MMVLSTIAFGLVDNLNVFDPERVVPGEDEGDADSTHKVDKEQELESNQRDLADSRGKLTIFLSLITFVCFVSNGALPSIQVSVQIPFALPNKA